MKFTHKIHKESTSSWSYFVIIMMHGQYNIKKTHQIVGHLADPSHLAMLLIRVVLTTPDAKDTLEADILGRN